MGHTNPERAIRQFVLSTDKGVTEVTTPGGKQKMTIINESGMYDLMFESKLDRARAFRHWVTSEVLPSIRKTGGYQIKPTDELRQKNILIREQNAKIRTAQLLYKIADRDRLQASLARSNNAPFDGRISVTASRGQRAYIFGGRDRRAARRDGIPHRTLGEPSRAQNG